mgnify:CR=1 FL=1
MSIDEVLDDQELRWLDDEWQFNRWLEAVEPNKAKKQY